MTAKGREDTILLGMMDDGYVHDLEHGDGSRMYPSVKTRQTEAI